MTPTASNSSASSSTAWSASDLRRNPHEELDKAERVQRMFAAIARQYDLNNRLHSFGQDQLWRRRTVEHCEVRPHEDHVLDVACGTGDLSMAFAQASPASVIGVDFTPEMIHLARIKAASATPQPGLSPAFVLGDALSLPFNDGSFDIVSIAFGIRNVADPVRALREFRRVLRPQGRLAILEFSRPDNILVRLGSSIYCDYIMPVTATLIARDRSGAYRYLPRSVKTFLNPPRMVEMIGQEGFRDICTWRMSLGICTLYVARRA
jgi:demethylmenaquinone methyltransferase/2-methoxy-6-polyprenyl-1,4-benzoquinol methylase